MRMAIKTTAKDNTSKVPKKQEIEQIEYETFEPMFHQRLDLEVDYGR
jgi:hypothetical protein